MHLRRLDFAPLMRRLEAALSVTLPTVALREGSDEIATSRNGYPDADVSSLSIALYQMGLCKHLPNASAAPPSPPIA
jgi:hypothetical protein